MSALIRLTNVVAGAEMAAPLALPQLAHFLTLHLPQYRSIKHRLTHPRILTVLLKTVSRRRGRVTALVYPTGQLTVCGAKSVEEALEETQKMVKLCAQFLQLPNLPAARIKTITATTSFPRTVSSLRLEQVKALWPDHSSLEPEIFNGLVLQFTGSVKLILFHTYRCIIAGARTVSEAESAANELARVLCSSEL